MAMRVSFEDWQNMMQDFPTVGEAERWRVKNGIEVEGLDGGGELPPIQAQGALDVVPEEGEMEDEGAAPAGALDLANLDFSNLRNDPSVFNQLYAASMAADQRAAQSAQQLYEEGRKRIMEKYAGPSQAERFFALSRAMLSPRKVPGFGGFMGSVMGTFGDIESARRQAEQEREERLLALQQQYQQGQLQREAQRPKTALELAKTYLSATKPTPRSSTSPVTVGPDMKVRSRQTGSVINEPPQPAIYELQAYLADPNNTPENKEIARRNFDARFGYGAARIYGEQ